MRGNNMAVSDEGLAMRGLFVVLCGLMLSGCCTPPPKEAAVTPCPCAEQTPAVEEKVEVVPMPATIDEAIAEGFLICERDEDVRIVGVRELESGKCLLVYDNQLSGNGTQNILPNKDACELQQMRMRQNFTRSGFQCK